MPIQPRRTSRSREADLLIQHAFEIACELDIRTLIALTDDLRDLRAIEAHRSVQEMVWLTASPTEHPLSGHDKNVVLPVAGTALNRVSLTTLGLFLAVVHKCIAPDESVLCLSSGVSATRIDNVLLTNPARDFPWFRAKKGLQDLDELTTPLLVRVIDIALTLAAEGREGKAIGTIFVVGELAELQPHLRQLVLNPCSGHPRRKRSVHDGGFVETLREFAALDGAFVVDTRGVVESAGTYLDAPNKKTRLPLGLGARHAAAAAITAATSASAVVISESSGTVTAFRGGAPVLALEKQ